MGLFVTVYLTALLSATVVYAGLEDCSSLPAPNNGKVQLAFSKSDRLLAIYTCNEGYAAVGKTILSCVNGKWDKIPPFCASLEECDIGIPVDSQRRRCPILTSPRFGRMDTSLEGGLREKATFNCFNGYYLDGSDSLYCTHGKWMGQMPECKPVDCGEPEAPANGTVEFSDTHFMARAHYKCDACHILNGVNKRSCKPSRQWSKSVPECVLRTDVCPLPDLPEGAHILGGRDLLKNGVACGESVPIQCQSGHQVEAVCNPDGLYTWGSTC